eukprot:7798337-Lingulodinium_polyedra.AAC.1
MCSVRCHGKLPTTRHRVPQRPLSSHGTAGIAADSFSWQNASASPPSLVGSAPAAAAAARGRGRPPAAKRHRSDHCPMD